MSAPFLLEQSELKPTPGPWQVEGTTVYALHGHPPRNRFSALVQSGRRDDASEEEKIANARLMAASPELLDALQEIVGELEVGNDFEARQIARFAGRAAIRKATLGSAS